MFLFPNGFTKGSLKSVMNYTFERLNSRLDALMRVSAKTVLTLTRVIVKIITPENHANAMLMTIPAST